MLIWNLSTQCEGFSRDNSATPDYFLSSPEQYTALEIQVTHLNESRVENPLRLGRQMYRLMSLVGWDHYGGAYGHDLLPTRVLTDPDPVMVSHREHARDMELFSEVRSFRTIPVRDPLGICRGG